MSNHHITIAKAAFTAACLRPDVNQLAREELVNFHTFFEAAVSECTSSNVQTCKKWLSEYIIPSSQRTTALGKYLVSFSKNTVSENAPPSKDDTTSSRARRRLHLLYVLNDLLHHAKYHAKGPDFESHVIEGLQAHILDLVALARSGQKRRVIRRLEDLVNIWEKEQYFSKEIFAQIRDGAANPDKDEVTTTRIHGSTEPVRETPYIMPAVHGDPTVPYYDLPAANLMPHIVPNKSIPMRPDQIRALQLSAGPADEGLINAVKDFLKDVERVDNPYKSLEDEDVVIKMDELGQLSQYDEAGEVTGDTYYGWSKDFCSKMKKRGQEAHDNKRAQHDSSQDSSRQGSRSRSRSQSFSRSPPKRRRYERSRSQSPAHRQRFRSRSRSQSPAERTMNIQRGGSASYVTQAQDLGQEPAAFSGARANTPYPAFSLGADGLHIPSARPPNHIGPWPSPPLPAGLGSVAFSPPSQFYPGPGASRAFYDHKDRN